MAWPLGPGQVPWPEGGGQNGAGPKSRGQGRTAGEASGGPRSVSGIWSGRGRGGGSRVSLVALGRGRWAWPGQGDFPLGRPSCVPWAAPAASLSLSPLSRACGRCGRRWYPQAWLVMDHGPPRCRWSPARVSHVCPSCLRGGACRSVPLHCRQAWAAGPREAQAHLGRRWSRPRHSSRGLHSARGIGTGTVPAGPAGFGEPASVCPLAES